MFCRFILKNAAYLGWCHTLNKVSQSEKLYGTKSVCNYTHFFYNSNVLSHLSRRKGLANMFLAPPAGQERKLRAQ